MPIDWAELRDRVRRTTSGDGAPGARPHADAEIDACLGRALAELTRWWPPAISPARDRNAAFALPARAVDKTPSAPAAVSPSAGPWAEPPLVWEMLSNEQVDLLVMGAAADLDLGSGEAHACVAPARMAAARARRTAFGQLLRHFGGRLAN